MKLKIGLAQMLSEKGAVAENLKAIGGYIREASQRDADILALPEAAITGYNNPLKYPKAALALDGPEITSFIHSTRGYNVTVLAGLIEKNPGKPPYLTHIAVKDGRLLGKHRKHIVYDARESEPWFSAGNEIRVLNHGEIKYGIAICADIGYEGLFAEYARQGAKIIFELAAPGLYGEQATRNWKSGYEWWEGVCKGYFERRAREYGVWIAVATAAGRTKDEDFPGGGYLFSPEGKRVYAAKDWRAGAVWLEVDLGEGKITKCEEIPL